MRLLASLRWRFLALARRLGYRGNPRLHGVEVPLRLVPSPGLVARLDSGMYEAKEIGLVRRHLPAGVEVLELGASLGVVSAFILGRGPSRLVSYEAVPEMADRARAVVAHNHPGSGWELVAAAVVGSPASTTDFHWHPERTDSGSARPREGLVPLSVPAATLAEILDRHGFSPGAWLVMDIEGAEHEVVRSGASALRRLGGIVLETHDLGADRAEDVLPRLYELGFRLLGRHGRVAALVRAS